MTDDSAPDPPALWSRSALILALVFLSSYAYFYEGGGWNQNTRFDLVRAIVERRTVQIDAYHENTGDKAHFGDHFYTDKAPGASLTAVPPVVFVRQLMRTVGAKVYTDRTVIELSYVATLSAAALPAAIAALGVFWIGVRFGASTTAAAIGAIACGLGSPLWAYATLLYGHALAAGCLMAALVAAVRLRDATTARSQIVTGLVAGLAAGWSVVTEFPASIAAAMILAAGLWDVGFADVARLRRTVVAIGVGLLASGSVLLAYNWMAFGMPFHIAYTSEEGYEAMRTGIFGVNWPKADVAWALLFGEYRGLLPLAPVLGLAPIGFWWLVRDRRSQVTALTAMAVAVYYFLLTAGYAYWSGGWSYGSRHLGPALPFLCLGIAPLWQHGRALGRAAISLLLVVSVGLSLVAVSTTPQPNAGVDRPMRDLMWPAFKASEFPVGWQSVLELRPSDPPPNPSELGVMRPSWNVGQLMGLRGQASLLPLFAVWIVAAVAWGRTRRSIPLG